MLSTVLQDYSAVLAPYLQYQPQYHGKRPHGRIVYVEVHEHLKGEATQHLKPCSATEATDGRGEHEMQHADTNRRKRSDSVARTWDEGGC